jgi:DNA-directed RNA polymerase specialized sigma24 family protein
MTDYDEVDKDEFGLFNGIPEDGVFPRTDEYAAMQEGPFAGLLKAEIRNIERRAHMTYQQATAFDMALVYGFNNCEIARLMGISAAAVRKHLDFAYRKAEQLDNIGFMTVIIEQFGWKGFRDLMRQ